MKPYPEGEVLIGWTRPGEMSKDVVETVLSKVTDAVRCPGRFQLQCSSSTQCQVHEEAGLNLGADTQH